MNEGNESFLLIVLIIELLSFLLSLHGRSLTVQEIQPLAFKQLVSLGARHGRKEFFRQLVLVLGTALFDGLHGFKSSSAGDQFVGPFGVVSLASVDLGVSVFVVAESEHFFWVF